MYRLEFTDEAKASIAKMKRGNPVSFKKVTKFLGELMEHPRTGTGHPEALAGSNGVTYSRRINKKDRLVYDIYDDIVAVLVITAEGHYSDK
ncbi:MAG: Txe/YoeB family addiction module toxin [Muribaculaceae bacterium]|nr:Txe/YoeB family addiction module toxin [Muribaculaceae bacterium]